MEELRDLFRDIVNRENISAEQLGKFIQGLQGGCVRDYLRSKLEEIAVFLNRDFPEVIRDHWIDCCIRALCEQAQYIPQYNHPSITLDDFLITEIYSTSIDSGNGNIMTLLFSIQMEIHEYLRDETNFWQLVSEVLRPANLFELFHARFHSIIIDGNPESPNEIWEELANTFTLRSPEVARCLYIKAWHLLVTADVMQRIRSGATRT